LDADPHGAVNQEISDTSRLPSEITRALPITARQGPRKKTFIPAGAIHGVVFNPRISALLQTVRPARSASALFESPSSPELPVDCNANKLSHIQFLAAAIVSQPL